MADATYQPKVYHDNQGDRLNIISGGQLNIESGSSFAVAGVLEIATGGSMTMPVQTLTTSGTEVTNFGVSLLTGTTASIAYAMAAPVAGLTKHLVLNPSSSGVTHRCTVYTGSTGVSLNSTGANTLTLSTSALTAVSLVGLSATAWRVSGSVGAYAGFSNKST